MCQHLDELTLAAGRVCRRYRDDVEAVIAGHCRLERRDRFRLVVLDGNHATPDL